MDLPKKLKEAEEKLQEAIKQRESWNTKIIDLNARCNQLKELIEEKEGKKDKK